MKSGSLSLEASAESEIRHMKAQKSRSKKALRKVVGKRRIALQDESPLNDESYEHEYLRTLEDPRLEIAGTDADMVADI
eukprot:12404700-Karenia_brevis.AAC.1